MLTQDWVDYTEAGIMLDAADGILRRSRVMGWSDASSQQSPLIRLYRKMQAVRRAFRARHRTEGGEALKGR